MSGMQLLRKTSAKMRDVKYKKNAWTYRVNNKLKGTFGETDPAKRTIEINKKLHAQKSGGHLIKNANGTEKLIGTIVHETIHAQHPQMHEKTVRKLTPRRLQKLSKRTKGRLYSRFTK